MDIAGDAVFMAVVPPKGDPEIEALLDWDNEYSEEEGYDGQPVTYGSVVQLMHVKSQVP